MPGTKETEVIKTSEITRLGERKNPTWSKEIPFEMC